MVVPRQRARKTCNKNAIYARARYKSLRRVRMCSCASEVQRRNVLVSADKNGKWLLPHPQGVVACHGALSI